MRGSLDLQCVARIPLRNLMCCSRSQQEREDLKLALEQAQEERDELWAQVTRCLGDKLWAQLAKCLIDELWVQVTRCLGDDVPRQRSA